MQSSTEDQHVANFFCLFLFVFFCVFLFFVVVVFFLFNLFAFSSVVNMGSYGYEISFFQFFTSWVILIT